MLFCSSQNAEKNMYLCSTKILIIFHIDNNNKCFLSIKSAYKNDFWKIMTLKTGVMMLKIQLSIMGLITFYDVFKQKKSSLKL